MNSPTSQPARLNHSWHERAAKHTPAGVHSNARLVGRDVVFEYGDGAWLIDVDGQRHIDYMLGRGPAFLGHTPTAINEAVSSAAKTGITLGGATRLEIEATEAALSLIPWADQLRFLSSGTEAVQAAFRIARGVTGRSLIVQFEGLYHGWLDDVMLDRGTDPLHAAPITRGQKPTSHENTILLPWNDTDAVDKAFAEHGSHIAAVITEPVNVFGGFLPSPGFLQHVRNVTTAHGSLLIFDEVVAGFRLQPGSSASLVGVNPDLGTYAKALGSGWPVAAVAGRGDLYSLVAADQIRLSGTYNGNAAAMAAVIATVQATSTGDVHRGIERFGSALMKSLADVCSQLGVNAACEGYPTAFWLVFSDVDRNTSDAAAEQLGLLLRDERVITYHHTWLTSAAHGEDALQFTIPAFERAMRRLIDQIPALQGR
jgi:glutamate-1-semialdehyde 2,1-aminomutase